MGYVVIYDDGEIRAFKQTPSYEILPNQLGEHGIARVQLAWDGASAYLPDCGLLMPDTYRRNKTGTCVLAALGAAPQPYAGNIAITGYDPPYGMDHLPRWAEVAVMDMYHAVECALAGLESGHGPEWDEQIRQTAELAINGQIPPVTFGATEKALP